ncbi:MAG: DegV family protein, partial [Acidimicrobiales bacterium]
AQARGASVSTAAPSVGEVAEAYRQAADGGATAIVSVHVGSALSGTFNACRLAAAHSPVPVELVDSGTASFALGGCVWAAADVLASGSGPADAARMARRVADQVGNVFVVSSLTAARRGGRLAAGAASERIPVLALQGDRMEVLGEVDDDRDAVATMAAHVEAWGDGVSRLRVGVGDADAAEMAADLAHAVSRLGRVAEVVRYQVGPSVAVHTGPGTAGAVFFPVEPGGP